MSSSGQLKGRRAPAACDGYTRPACQMGRSSGLWIFRPMAAIHARKTKSTTMEYIISCHDECCTRPRSAEATIMEQASWCCSQPGAVGVLAHPGAALPVHKPAG